MIELQQFQRADIKKFISWFDREEYLYRACGNTFKFPLDENQLEQYIKGVEAKPQVRQIYKAVDLKFNLHIGNLTIERINREAGTAAIACVVIGEEFFLGKGICKMMIDKAIDIAFIKLGLIKLTLNVYDFNSPAVKCYQSSGFKEIERTIVKFGDDDYVNVKMELNHAPPLKGARGMTIKILKVSGIFIL